MGRKKISEGGSMPKSAFKPGHPNYLKSGQVPNPKGRAPTYTEELGERIIEALWSGECKSLTDVEREDWAPTRRTMYNWKEKYPEFGAQLLKAQLALAELYVDENRQIVSRMLVGELDPSAANVAIKSNQWLATASDPRTYANKSYVDKNETKTVTHVFSNRIPVEDLSDDELDALEGALIKSKLMLPGPTQN